MHHAVLIAQAVCGSGVGQSASRAGGTVRRRSDPPARGSRPTGTDATDRIRDIRTTSRQVWTRPAGGGVRAPRRLRPGAHWRGTLSASSGLRRAERAACSPALRGSTRLGADAAEACARRTGRADGRRATCRSRHRPWPRLLLASPTHLGLMPAPCQRLAPRPRVAALSTTAVSSRPAERQAGRPARSSSVVARLRVVGLLGWSGRRTAGQRISRPSASRSSSRCGRRHLQHIPSARVLARTGRLSRM